MKRSTDPFSRRERQIMNVVYERKRATVAEVVEALPDAPSYNTVRTLLGTLVKKGHLNHVADGPRYVYFTTTPAEVAGQTALGRVVKAFYEGSPARAAMALLASDSPSEQELDELQALIAKAREKGA